MENLRHMLSQYNSSKPLYFGCKFKKFVKNGYMSGGAGYVLSKEALYRFVNIGLKDKSGTYCRKDPHGPEDLQMGKCLENLNVSTLKLMFFLKYLKFAPKKQITAVHSLCQFNEGVLTLLSQILSCLAPLVRDLRFHSQLVILI